MSDPLNEVLARHREIWETRLYYVAAVAIGAGVILGYLIRAWVG